MRVISGSAKGIRLRSVPSKSTRPITDQVKEALFNIIGNKIDSKHFLDLFGGTGAVGIEALSRGAEYAVFLDTNFRAVKVIEENLHITQLESYAVVLKKDALTYLSGVPEHAFDFVYIAPPQYKSIWSKALHALDKNPNWLKPGGSVIVQIDPKEFTENINIKNFSAYDQRKYGDTLLIFYEQRL